MPYINILPIITLNRSIFNSSHIILSDISPPALIPTHADVAFIIILPFTAFVTFLVVSIICPGTLHVLQILILYTVSRKLFMIVVIFLLRLVVAIFTFRQLIFKSFFRVCSLYLKSLRAKYLAVWIQYSYSRQISHYLHGLCRYRHGLLSHYSISPSVPFCLVEHMAPPPFEFSFTFSKYDPPFINFFISEYFFCNRSLHYQHILKNCALNGTPRNIPRRYCI